jgi:hypothetical protein
VIILGVRPNSIPAAYDGTFRHGPRAPRGDVRIGLPTPSRWATLCAVVGWDLGGTSTDLASDEVAEARAMLRRSDVATRRTALQLVDSWPGKRLAPGTASALLRASTVSYPWLRGERADPADRFARILWNHPRALPVAEVEGAYLISTDRVRRSLLHLLALRRDAAGLASVEFLIGPDGPVDLLPLPTSGLLSPVLDVVEAPRLVRALVSVAGRRGWAWHASELLAELAEGGRLDERAESVVVDGLTPLALVLVDACDRAVAEPGERGDPTRADRHRLRAVGQVLAALPGPTTTAVLLRMLSAVDPRVAARGAVALVQRGEPVAPERLALIGLDPESRGILLDGLDRLGRVDLLPPGQVHGRARAEADLVTWLAGDTELARAPDEVEHVLGLPTGDGPDAGELHLFRFRVRAPHWSCARGWMVGAAGPYLPDGRPGSGVEPFASSLYSAQDEDGPDGHLEAILDSLGDWPER